MENNSIDNAERTGKGVKFERLRRIKVYLVGTVDRWNDTGAVFKGRVHGIGGKHLHCVGVQEERRAAGVSGDD